MGLMKKLTSAVVASSLVLASVGTALAAPTAEQVQGAFDRLATYNLAKGRLQADGTVDPALGETINRAELATLMVRAFGQDATAQLLSGAASFSDVASTEWYSGYVALVKNLSEKAGIPVGYEDGSFKPAQQVTAVEALAFAMKLLGVAPGTGANWAADTVAIALANGIITEADATALLDEPTAPATRGLAFAIADAVFNTAKVGDKTIYRTYVDNQAPVLTVNQPAEPTVIAAKATITGSVSGAKALYLGTEAITPNADGTFSVEVELKVGANDIVFTAVDEVGNTTEASYKVTRQAGAPANVAIEVANEIVAGSEVDLAINVTDATGAAIEVAADDIKVDAGTLGTYADGKFTASTKTGAGTITVTVGELTGTADVKVVAGALAKVEAEATSVKPGTAVKLIATDANGNTVEGVTFSSTAEGVFLSGDQFIAPEAGQYEVTATKGEVSITGTIGVYGSVAKVVIEAPENMVANGKSEYKLQAKLVDNAGNVVTSAKNDIVLEISGGITATADGAIKDGVQTYKVTFPTDAADADLTVTATYDTDTDTAGLQASKEFTAVVSPVAPIATKIELSSDNTYLPTAEYDSKEFITVKILDQADKSIDNEAWELTVKVSGPALLVENDKKEASISLSSNDTFAIGVEDTGDVGNITVTAAFPGMTTGTLELKAAVPGAAKGIRITSKDTEVSAVADADNTVTYTVQVVDKNGVPSMIGVDPAVTSLNVTLDKNLKSDFSYFVDGDVAIDPATDSIGTADGAEKVTVAIDASGKGTFKVASNRAGSYTVKVQDADKDFSEVSSSFTVTAAKAAAVGLTKSDIDVLRANDAKTSVSAQLYDKYGNKAAVAGVKVKFKAADYDGVTLNGADKDVSVTTDANGVATVEVGLATYADAASITVEDNDDSYTLVNVEPAEWAYSTNMITTANIGVVNTIASSISGEMVLDDTEYKTIKRSIVAGGESGNYVALKFTVLDNYGRPVKGLANDDVLAARNFKLSASADLEADLSTDDIAEIADGVYVTGPIQSKGDKAGNISVTVEVLSVAKELKVSRSVNVIAADPTLVTLAEGTDFARTSADAAAQKLTLAENKVTKVTLQVTDEFGNLATASKNKSKIRVTFNGLNVRTSPDGADLAYVEIPAGRNSLTVYVSADADVAATLEARTYDSVGDAWNVMYSDVNVGVTVE